MTAALRIIAIVSLWAQLVPAMAQRVLIDDSLSPQETYAVKLGWERPVIGRAIASLLAGTGDTAAPMTGRVPGVETRLDTSGFEGEQVRIYLSIPTTVAGLTNPGDLELRWEAVPPFLSGATQPGQSALVYEGRIEQAVTIARFNFALLLNSPETASIELEPV
jgi:hypothetical protein